MAAENEAASDASAKAGASAKADASAKKAPRAPKTETTSPGDPLVRGRLAEVGALLSGVLYFVAFAGFDVWPLTFVCLVPLYVSLAGQTPRRATWLGFLTGLAMNVGGFYWLVNMLRTFSGFPTPLCVLFTLIICAYQGGRLALMGWLYGRATVRGWPAPIVFGAAFAASELAYPLLFPWYYAATVHQVPVLLQLAELGGPILVGLVLVSVNLAIAEPLRARLAAAREVGARTVAGASSEERHSVAIDRRVVGAGVIALVVALLFGAVRISMVNARVAKSEEVHVGYVQGNMGLMAKRENPGEGLRRHKQMTAALRDKGADLVVWSETSATFPTREDLATKGHFYRDRFAASLGVPTIFGAVLYRVDPDRERWFNTAISTDVKGELRGRYDKQYLLAFGEYLPFGDTFPILYKWSPHSGRFSPGKSLEPLIVDVKGVEHKVTALICYEDILPGFTNRAVSYADPELIVNMTNDAWFGDTTEPWQHLALAKLRAIEHRRFLVRSTNSGVSAIIDPNGAIVEGTLSTPFKAESHDAVIRWMKGGTVYEAIGDVPWYAVSLGIAVAAFRRRRPRSA
ncbi:MAG: apolipoprotein N-acyltransferase [Labilithrix sp.]|nr:apolipoprotein N-acyltransferase [Labilithrix sp.]